MKRRRSAVEPAGARDARKTYRRGVTTRFKLRKWIDHATARDQRAGHRHTLREFKKCPDLKGFSCKRDGDRTRLRSPPPLLRSSGAAPVSLPLHRGFAAPKRKR